MSKDVIVLPRKALRKIARDPEKGVALVQLVYVSDTQPGIRRVRNGSGFYYTQGKNKITQKKLLERIDALVIPPAWENVWICRLPEGHLQVTGLDARHRKQYKYHPLWASFRNQTKFNLLYDFGKVLPRIRRRIERDIALPGLPVDKVLAAAVSLMERTTIRVGNAAYEKLYGSFGLSTLKDKHVAINGSSIKLSFTGKKGIHHSISLKSRKLATILRKCRDIPGKELFQFYDENGERHPIDSGMVNEYIRVASGGDFTSKDLRTWSGSVKALLAFKEIDPPKSAADAKRGTVAALDQVSLHLGNSRTVCRKYYVHPLIISLYEENRLQQYLDEIPAVETQEQRIGLTGAEKALMKILGSDQSRKIAI